MSAYANDPQDPRLPATVVAAIRDVVREHPFWSYEQVAQEVRLAGHMVTVIGVAWVVSAR